MESPDCCCLSHNPEGAYRQMPHLCVCFTVLPTVKSQPSKELHGAAINRPVLRCLFCTGSGYAAQRICGIVCVQRREGFTRFITLRYKFSGASCFTWMKVRLPEYLSGQLLFFTFYFYSLRVCCRLKREEQSTNYNTNYTLYWVPIRNS